MPETARCWLCHALVKPGAVHEHDGLAFTAIPSHERKLKGPGIVAGLIFLALGEPNGDDW